MKLCIKSGIVGVILLSLILCIGTSTGDIPPISVQNAHSTITADFSADKQEGKVPFTVSFTDLSTGIRDHFEWSFGDGENSSEQNPIHTYFAPGVYTVSLSVSGTAGSDKKTRIGYISVSEPDSESVSSPEPVLTERTESTESPIVVQNGEITEPDDQVTVLKAPEAVPEQNEPTTPVPVPVGSSIHADFSVADGVGLSPLKVSFIDLSTGPVSSWLWNFGDGTTSAAKSPIHIYQTDGTYDITLHIEGDGSSDTITKTGIVQVITPVVSSFTAEPTEGTTPLQVRFKEQTSGTIVSREWSFGDGLFSELENPVHVYEKPGTYEVSLKVTGIHNEDILTRPSYIIVHPDLPPPTLAPTTPTPEPTPSFSSVPEPVLPTPIAENIPVLSESVSSPAPEESHNPFPVVSEQVLPEPEEIVIPDIANQIPESSEGTEDTGETIEPNTTAELSETSEPVTPVSKPSVDFVFTPESGDAPLSVQFTDTSTGAYETRYWDFGDGSNSTEPAPTHIFDNPGDYPVRLTLYYAGSEESVEKSSVISVLSPPKTPVADFSVSSTEGTAPFAIVCTDQSEGVITEWIWDFGDGKVLRGKNPTHTYITPGQYSITLTVRGPGGKDELRKNAVINVLEAPPVLKALFSADPVQGSVPLDVSFHDDSTGIITAWDWDFGDGISSSEQNPAHVYTSPGTYHVKLSITGPDGTDVLVKENFIVAEKSIEPVRASFSALPISGDAPLTVAFTDKSTGDVENLTWFFGDGLTSNEKNPEHTYTKPGIYTVRLNADGPGVNDSVEKTDLISVLGSALSPELIITAKPAKGTAPLTVTFGKTDIGNVMSSQWSFGDGNTSSDASPVHTYTLPGVYTVSLTIQDVEGQSRTITKNEFVNVTTPIPPPVANFSSNGTEGYAPYSVRFTDQSLGEITEWIWDFGDGSSAKTQDAVHTYNATGSYLVSLNVKGPGGENRYSAPQPVLVKEPVPVIPESKADNISPVQTRGEEPFIISYESNQSNQSLIVVPVISEPMVVPNRTSLNVPPNESSDNQSARINRTEKIEQEMPIPVNETETFTSVSKPESERAPDTKERSEIQIPEIIVSEKTGPAPLTVDFSSSWAKENGTYLWKFGDGMTSNESEVTHTYTKPGIYSVHLTREFEGNTQEIINTNLINVTESISIPIASFSADPVSGPTPLHVTFRSESTGTISDWKWDFGDSSHGTGETVTHTYTHPGIYTVSVQVHGPDGSSTEVREDYITVGTSLTPPQARFRTDKRTGYAPLKVRFTDQSLGKVSDWKWDFGDGEISPERNPTHVFNKTGVYSVSLTVSGPSGTNQVSRKGYIVVSPEPEPLVAGFSLKPSEGIAPLSVQCTDESTGSINRYLWEFGDGAVSETRHPSHRYTAPGSYIIKLTVYGPSGVSSADQVVTVGPTYSKSGRMNPSILSSDNSKRNNQSDLKDSDLSETSKPIADFVINKKSGKTPLSISCEDRSTGTIESWSWNFGDDSNSVEQNPVHTYTKPGTYTISLTVKGPYGVSTKKLRDAIQVFD
ncbi:PKD domain-containing protein [Methanospirillum hungatei]|uniref:PKD domain-containing protein n=1 Tax=Methanospirillum hungatei TaxID=2203 RepID=UPI0026EAC961|nr:PKD domain-containing protein [Methanospirillum hungatei]